MGKSAHCGACHQTFANVAQFDGHQVTDYSTRPAVQCKTPQSLGLVLDSHGVWRTPEAVSANAEKAARMRTARLAGVTA